MRPLLATLLLLLPLGAGCLGANVEPADAPAPVDLVLDKVPEGARVETLPEGVRLVWEAPKLPLSQKITIPAGATVVRATAEVGEADTLSVLMRNNETGRRRCQVPSTEAWNEPTRGRMTCAGLAAIDPPGAVWSLSVGSAGKAKLVTVDFLSTPLAGPAAKLDLSQLSMPTYDLLKTEVKQVPSFDGTLLHVEVTRPDAPEKVPAVIVSSPYTEADRMAGRRTNDDTVKDWGARGYAIVVADVRGYGRSDGCVEVWSENEQKDQKALVEWVAKQDWSDGSVGFYGQSYVGTTPVAAAVQAPSALKAIIAVAPVIDAYHDWHFGGVPNGEDALSPLTYQQLGGGTDVMEPEYVAQRADNGFCDPTLTARANDPRAVYDAFYEERNFSARAKAVTAAVLYTQGYIDSNVKSAMIAPWFNELAAPKLGLFGPWVHQHPPRADQEVLFLGWMDQYVKGKPLGFENVQGAIVMSGSGTERHLPAWPAPDAVDLTLWPDLGGGKLGPEPKDGSADIQLLSASPSAVPVQVGLPEGPLPLLLSLDHAVEEAVELSGIAHLDLAAQLAGAQNGYVAAFLYDKGPDGFRLVTFGMYNLAHRPDHATYAPASPGETLRVSLPLLPTDHVFEAGHTLHLEVRGAHTSDWALVKPTEPGRLTVLGGKDGTRLVLPTLPLETAQPVPATVDWVIRDAAPPTAP